MDCVAVVIADDVTEQEGEEESHVMIFYCHCLSCPVRCHETSHLCTSTTNYNLQILLKNRHGSWEPFLFSTGYGYGSILGGRTFDIGVTGRDTKSIRVPAGTLLLQVEGDHLGGLAPGHHQPGGADLGHDVVTAGQWEVGQAGPGAGLATSESQALHTGQRGASALTAGDDEARPAGDLSHSTAVSHSASSHVLEPGPALPVSPCLQ